MKPVIPVTLVMGSSVYLDQCEWVFQDTASKCNITGDMIWYTDLVTESPFAHVFPFRVEGNEGYQRWALHHLPIFAERFNTSHVLVMQPDTMIANPMAWEDGFLEYDYIGSPWAGGECGNGGFSLRSKRFLEAQMKLGPEIMKFRREYFLRNNRSDDIKEVNEDYVMCSETRLRNRFLELGIKFADVETGSRFSTETTGNRMKADGKPDGRPGDGIRSFGVHGWYALHSVPGWVNKTGAP